MRSIWNSIVDWFNSFKGGEPIEVAGITVAIEKFNMAKFLAGLVGPILSTAWNIYRETIYNMAMMAAMAVRKGTAHRDWQQAQAEYAKLFETYLAKDDEWLPMARAYFSTMLDPKGKAGVVGPAAGQFIEELGGDFMGDMLNMVLPTGYPPTETGAGLSPEDGIRGAERFLGTNMRFQMQGTMMQMIADQFGLKDIRAISRFPETFSWAFGFGWLSWLVMGTPFRLAIAEPMEKYFQKRYRMKDLSLSQVADFYWQDVNFTVEATTRLKEMGYTDDDIPRVLDKARKKLSGAQMQDLVRYAGMKVEDVIAELNSSGHDIDTATTLGNLLLSEPTLKLIEGIARAAEGQYKKDTITETDLRGYLEAAKHKPDEIALIIARLNLEKLEPPLAEPKQTGLTRAMVGSLYKRGDRPRSWVERKLTELNWDNDEVDDFLVYYQSDEEKEESGKSLTAGMIGTLYKRGWILKSKAENLWNEIGVRQSHIPLYAKFYTRPWDVSPDLPPLKLLSPDSVGKMYAAGLVSQDNAVIMLVEGGLAREDSILYLALFAAEAEEAADALPTLSIWEIAGAVADNLMSMSEGVARLVNAGYSQSAARNYLSLQVAYRVATNVSQACSAGTMTYAEALSAMVSAGWSHGDAGIYLQQHWCTPEP